MKGSTVLMAVSSVLYIYICNALVTDLSERPIYAYYIMEATFFYLPQNRPSVLFWLRINFFTLTFRGPCIVSILINFGIFPEDATLHSLFISGKLLYMFRVVFPPILASTHNCIYSMGSVHRKYITFGIFPTKCNVTLFIYFWKTALHVSDSIATQPQEHTQLYLQYAVRAS